LTTAHYFTPNNREIHEVGIEPDIGVTISPGHERELFQRGLLGDPTTIEDEEHRSTVNDQLNEVFEGDVEESTDTEQPEESDDEVETEQTGDTVTEVTFEEEEKPFRDIVLDEAINYIRVYVIMSREAA
jgi:C-terminal processing protease CtpA/Prc